MALQVNPFDRRTRGWYTISLDTIRGAVILAIVALLLVALAAPIGSFTVVLTLMSALAALSTDNWALLPGAVVGGAIVDLLVWSVPGRRRAGSRG